MAKTYSEKLKDPRWQKKRLEILNRDNFTCQLCQDKDSMLVVHHRWYEKGKEPWEYDNKVLICLCEDCHNSEHKQWEEYTELFIQTFKESGFFADHLREIAFGFDGLIMNEHPELMANSISHALRNKSIVNQMVAKFLKKYYKK